MAGASLTVTGAVSEAACGKFELANLPPSLGRPGWAMPQHLSAAPAASDPGSAAAVVARSRTSRQTVSTSRLRATAPLFVSRRREPAVAIPTLLLSPLVAGTCLRGLLCSPPYGVNSTVSNEVQGPRATGPGAWAFARLCHVLPRRYNRRLFTLVW